MPKEFTLKLPLLPKLKESDDRSSSDFNSWLIEVNRDIEELGRLITQYNIANEHSEQVEILKEIIQYNGLIEDKTSAKFINLRPEFFNTFHIILFNSIKKQASELKVDLLSLQGVKEAPYPSIKSAQELIHAMRPDKAQLLVEKLNDRRAPFNLGTLYALEEEGYVDYQEFLKSNTISLRSEGNNKIFKVTPHNGNPAFVLKLENRLEQTKIEERHLRKNLSKVFLKTFAERQVAIYDPHTEVTQTRFLAITEFCPGTDLESYITSPELDDDAVLRSALGIYSQMSSILLEFQAADCFFPDMKNSNWLIMPNGTLRLADTKSFKFTVQHGNYLAYGYTTRTASIAPPEINNKILSADRAHSYMLGKNLYQYLSGCKSNYFFHLDEKTRKPDSRQPIHSAEDLDFDDPIFKTALGLKFKSLIEKTVTERPEERLSVAQIENEMKLLLFLDKKSIDDMPLKDNTEKFDELYSAMKEALNKITYAFPLDPESAREKIGQLYQKNSLEEIQEFSQELDIVSECADRLEFIEDQAFGADDQEMKKFIAEQKAAILTQSGKELEQTKTKLEKIYTAPVTKLVKDEIKALQSKTGFGIKKKVDRIIQAMGKVPVEQRSQVGDDNVKGVLLEAQEAIGARRYSLPFGQSEKEAFKEFKQKAQALKKPDDDSPDDSPRSSSTSSKK